MFFAADLIIILFTGRKDKKAIFVSRAQSTKLSGQTRRTDECTMKSTGADWGLPCPKTSQENVTDVDSRVVWDVPDCARGVSPKKKNTKKFFTFLITDNRHVLRNYAYAC